MWWEHVKSGQPPLQPLASTTPVSGYLSWFTQIVYLLLSVDPLLVQMHATRIKLALQYVQCYVSNACL